MSEPSPIRVILIDDHQHIHDSVETILRQKDNIQLVGQGYNGQDALDLCARVHPDIVLMDVMMPLMDGIEATRTINQEYPDVRVLVVSSIFDHQSVYAMLGHGASGYVMKGSLATTLTDSIQTTFQGNFVFSPEVAEQLKSAPPQQMGDRVGITDRELEVLGLLAGGLTFKEIASNLSISVSTVKFHMSNIQEKFGVSTRTEALVIAAKNNLV